MRSEKCEELHGIFLGYFLCAPLFARIYIEVCWEILEGKQKGKMDGIAWEEIGLATGRALSGSCRLETRY